MKSQPIGSPRFSDAGETQAFRQGAPRASRGGRMESWDSDLLPPQCLSAYPRHDVSDRFPDIIDVKHLNKNDSNIMSTPDQ